MENLLDWDKLSELFTLYAPKVIGALLTIIIGFWLAGVITRAAKRAMERRGMDASVRPFIGSLINVAIKVMVLIAAAGMFGIETTSFIAVFGALAFAIGMALQGSLGHFASGVLILTFKPFKVGDLVEIGGGKRGVVEEIQVFNTVLATKDNKRIILPNALVTNNPITNISGQGLLGVELTFGISYNDDIDKARDIILQVGKSCPHILEEPVQAVVVATLGDSSVNLATRPFCDPAKYWDVYFYMQENVKKEFDKQGISIPFPQMDVHTSAN